MELLSWTTTIGNLSRRRNAVVLFYGCARSCRWQLVRAAKIGTLWPVLTQNIRCSNWDINDYYLDRIVWKTYPLLLGPKRADGSHNKIFNFVQREPRIIFLCLPPLISN